VQWSLHSAKLEKGAPTGFPDLPSGKELFKKNKKLCRVPPIRHSAKNFFKKK